MMEENVDQSREDLSCVKKSEEFKKPLLFIGPRKGNVVGKIRTLNRPYISENAPLSDCIPDSDEPVSKDEPFEEIAHEPKHLGKLSPAQKIKDIAIPLPYKEPNWSGVTKDKYAFEVLKSGSILEIINLSSKSFYVFGRLSTCDVCMAHPTVSRFHAVLQFNNVDSEDRPSGFYIYDLGSTHGTFLNKLRIKPKLYVKVHVGHMLKFGGSSRMFILQGPEKDMEKESELTVTQLKEKRMQEKAQEIVQAAEEEKLCMEEEHKGIDWGMGEDADEETDLAENPFASTQNEELFISDPKKTLRGWFEREGYELEYNVEEKGFGQFLCRVELPIEAARGGTMMAEALVKGKKKESVVQCALEACRILDRYGLLRQANHESKKRKAKNWEEEDFYDSDEDTFLDRTGAVEKKRMQRMQAAGKIETQTETYESLLKKHNAILSEIQEVESELQKVSSKASSSAVTADGEEMDALDVFMTNLSSEIPDRKLVSKLKSQLASLRQEETRLRKLVNLAHPASLPELAKPKESISVPKPVVGAKTGPIKRKASNSKQQLSETVSKNTHMVKEGVVAALDKPYVEEEEEEEEEEKKELDARKNKNENSISKNEVINLSCTCDISQIEANPTKQETSRKDDGEDSSSVDLAIKENVILSPKMSKVIGPSLIPSEDSSNNEPPEKHRKRSKRKVSHTKKQKESVKNCEIDYDSSNPAYSMWVPPENQSGDGRTKLNDKFGY